MLNSLCTLATLHQLPASLCKLCSRKWYPTVFLQHHCGVSHLPAQILGLAGSYTCFTFLHCALSDVASKQHYCAIVEYRTSRPKCWVLHGVAVGRNTKQGNLHIKSHHQPFPLSKRQNQRNKGLIIREIHITSSEIKNNYATEPGNKSVRKR